MNRRTFFDKVRQSVFGGSLDQDQVNGLSMILDTCEREGLSAPATAYVLATAAWETGRRMMPIREAYGRSDAEAYAKVSGWLKRNRRRNYAAIDGETGQSYYGRGAVMITHKANYAKASEALGHDFVNSPDDVMRLHFSAQILVRGMMEGWFTGKALPDYVCSESYDFRQARRVVNGLDKAREIADYAEKFLRALG